MSDLLPLGPGAWAFISLYLLSLIGVGWVAKKARTTDTLKDFYLAGDGFGLTVLFLTLFATQYSGNTFFAFTGATYRIGYAWILSLHFMTAVIVAYLLFAPKLHRLARQRDYLTPADFVQDRYANRALSVIVTIVMVIVLCNFLLAQLMAMGRAMQGLANDSGGTAYTGGVIILALIMVIYGTLGGMRAVAWTDALQGGILAIGFVILVGLLFDRFGPLSDATRLIVERDLLHGTRKALPPDAAQCRAWLSYILTVGFGICLYPQAIQRIYAARTPQVLRRSLALMAFMPLPTMIISLIAGIMALAYLPGLEGASADQIFGRVLREIQNHSTLGYGLVVVTLSAVLAAMMSTADSALLSISSMLTKDLCSNFLMPNASQAQLTRLGKKFSWSVIVVLIVLSLLLREKSSLVQLMDRKLDLLIQLVPAFIVGIRWQGLRGGAVLTGLIVGVTLALVLAFGEFSFTSAGKVSGFHPGLVALVPNLLIAVGGSMLLNFKSGTASDVGVAYR
jgi:solute:Na+ symporter, SSS family